MWRMLMMAVVLALSAGAVSTPAFAAAAQSCDQRMRFMEFRADAIRSPEARQQFNSAIAQARMDRDRGDERACQADVDAAERLLPH